MDTPSLLLHQNYLLPFSHFWNHGNNIEHSFSINIYVLVMDIQFNSHQRLGGSHSHLLGDACAAKPVVIPEAFHSDFLLLNLWESIISNSWG